VVFIIEAIDKASDKAGYPEPEAPGNHLLVALADFSVIPKFRPKACPDFAAASKLF